MRTGDHHTTSSRPVLFDRIFFLGAALVLTAVAAPSQTSPLDILSGAGRIVEGKAGTIVTVPVKFVNNSGRALTVRPSVTTPRGWRRIAVPSNFALPARGTDLQLLILSVPRDASVGQHPVSVVARLDADSAISARIEVRVNIPRSISVEALLVDAPRNIVAGSSGEFSYEVSNRGNDTAVVEFSARSSRGYEPTVSPRRLKMPPASTARVRVHVTADAEERLKAPHMLEFTSRLVPEGVDVRITTSSDIIPRSPSANLKKVDLPMFLTFRGTTEGSRSGLQTELVGGGSLQLDRSDQIQFLFRGPETQTVSVLGLRDEYRMRYSFGNTRITAGDDTYALTPLTDVGRTATGLGVQTEIGPSAFGAYVNQTRYSGPVAKQNAAWFRYDVTDDVKAGVNFLHRSDRVRADLVTLSASGTTFRNARLDVETGRSTGSQGPDYAYALRFGGMEPWLSYELRSVNAGPDYGGYYRGVRFSSLSLSGRTDRDIRIELSARDERRTPEADTVFGRYPRSNFIQMGMGYTNLFTLSYRATNMSDPVISTPVDRRQDIIEVRSAADLDFAFVTASAEIGVERDRSIGFVGPTQRFQTSLSLRPWARQSYNLSVEYDRSPDPTTTARTDRVSANLLASYLLAERTQASVTLFGSRMTGIAAQTYTMAEATVEHVFQSNHRVRFHGRRSAISGVDPELSAALEVSLPFDLPLGFDRSSGLLRGRIVERGNRGIPGVMVSLGAFATITDDAGRFAFNDLAPGTYSLSVDRGSLGIDKITTVALPMEVNIRGGAAGGLTLSVVQSGALHGRLRSFEGSELADSGAALLTETPVVESGLVSVELSRGDEVLRRVSDSRGRFSFTDLRTGVWTLRVVPLQLASDRAIESPERIVEISEGGSVDIDVRIVPRRRTIRLLQQGGVLKTQSPDDEKDEVCGTSLIRRALPGEGFVVQVSSWVTDDQARGDLNRIQRLTSGRRAWIERKEVPMRGTFFRVLVGPFPTRDSARDWCRSAATR